VRAEQGNRGEAARSAKALSPCSDTERRWSVLVRPGTGERQKAFPARPNVRAKPTVEADSGWPRKDDTNSGLERPDGGCRSGSAP